MTSQVNYNMCKLASLNLGDRDRFLMSLSINELHELDKALAKSMLSSLVRKNTNKKIEEIRNNKLNNLLK